MKSVALRIAEELAVKESQVSAAISLLDDGSTVPFISRYRKEATGGLDDTQLRNLEDRLRYLRELDARRELVLQSILEQGKLSDRLKAEILDADTKSRLEDLYLPYKQKRRTKAQIAREAGLEPLALSLLADPMQDPATAAAGYLDADGAVPDVQTALDGARQILMEVFAEDADLLAQQRAYLQEKGILESRVVPGKETEGAKFEDYFDFSEPLRKIPSHRALALFRGRNESVLQLSLKVENEETFEVHPCDQLVRAHFGLADKGRPADPWLLETARWAWRIKIFSHLDIELRLALKEKAEDEAIKVFASNLSDLLLAAPAGPRATLGLDPGLRTGVKVAVVDATGKLVDWSTVYPHAPRNQWDEAIGQLATLCRKHDVKLISIGNGTASRETDKLAKALASRHPELGLTSLVVSEAGASIYSASELAAKEFPDLDVSIRGAVSIARRLQDPLAELVKIEPKAIGVGQYQHDVSQVKLARSLEAVVEDCVNAVGVDLNMASVPLLGQVAGLSTGMAENIVSYRNEHGPFPRREALLDVPRIGPKAFEQAAGFLRIMNGDNPLDRSAVHPEAYPVVEKIVAATGKDVLTLIGDQRFVAGLNPADFTDEKFGTPTVIDILKELEKPGRDPRPEFRTATFREGVEKLGDLKPDMILEGVITNVTNFGAFVDIGVHQDGLVHISALAEKFVKDPREIVKAGDIVRVKVMEVDLERKRIALSMRLNDIPQTQADAATASRGGRSPGGREGQGRAKGKDDRQKKTPTRPVTNSVMGDAFARALKDN
ncbi:MAG: Tex family protein [Pseudomonadota bacterium]